MKGCNSITVSSVSRWIFVASIAIASPAGWAATWHSLVSQEAPDAGTQALAFLPNELWIHAGDSITWLFPQAAEIHTVTFLRQNSSPQQVRPPRPGVPGGGCPGTTSDYSDFDGSACVSSAELVGGATYTVNFPASGNFKFICQVHPNMTGAVHVLDPSEPLPYNQLYYDHQAFLQASDLFADGARLTQRAKTRSRQSLGNNVAAGIGEVVANAGGSHTVTVSRFLRDPMVVSVGDTVEWTNFDPATPHTVTFGPPPAPPQPPSAGVAVNSDGSRYAVLASTTDSVPSGFLLAADQDRTGLPQSPLGVTRFQVTFTQPGTFRYACALHAPVGMVGQVIVRE